MADARKLSMGSRFLCLLIPATFAGLTGPLQAATQVHDEVTALARDITYTSAALFPTVATQLGIAGHDGELETPSEAARNTYIDKLQQWQKQLEQIAPAGREDLQLVDRDDARLLAAQLATRSAGPTGRTMRLARIILSQRFSISCSSCRSRVSTARAAPMSTTPGRMY